MNATEERPRPVFDSLRPQSFLIERERSESGEVVPVATIFLTNRECPWRCIYCDLWRNTLTESVPPGAIPAQIDFALIQLRRHEFHESSFDRSGTRETRPSAIKQIKLYNSGNFFDPKAIPPQDFPAIAGRVAGFERLIVECHPALVGEPALRFFDLLRAARSGRGAEDHALMTNHDRGRGKSIPAALEVAMGLEIADDAILARLNKRMTRQMFARAAEFLREHDIAVRAFVIVKPPFVRSEKEALRFAQRSIDFAFDCGATVVSLIPARFGAPELAGLSHAGDFAPPQLTTLEAAFDYGTSLGRGRVFADLWDLEKLAGCTSCFEARRQRLDRINLHQQPLPRIDCRSCRKPGPAANSIHQAQSQAL